MSTAKVILDNRYHRSDGKYPIIIRTSVFGKKMMFPTGIVCKPSNFSESGGRSGFTWVSGSNSGSNNKVLRHRLTSLMDAISVVSTTNSFRGLSTTTLREKITHIIDGDLSKEPMLMETMSEFIGVKQGRTREIYQATLVKLKKFLKTDIPLAEINKGWLEHFQLQELAYTSQNSVSVHLKNIRAVFNYAIDNEITQCYPFRRFKIRITETPKRSLSIEQLNSLLAAKHRPKQVKYLDAFMLSFYLIGINPIDMLTLTASNLRNGRIEYFRHKTHKLYSVKVEPEAMAIMNKYRGKDYLIGFLEKQKHRTWIWNCDVVLKKIGNPPIEPKLSMYWARHTWATIAASLDIPKETISAALGHEIGSKITSIYIDFDQKKVDAANRKVIDYVLGKT